MSWRKPGLLWAEGTGVGRGDGDGPCVSGVLVAAGEVGTGGFGVGGLRADPLLKVGTGALVVARLAGQAQSALNATKKARGLR
ncbi:MAG: hypothetical protein VKN33_08095 [Candidatus Sericytochromatia bacterium]|nr:hypothetical protein [Candidatus Sericytochromatia bacterium]